MKTLLISLAAGAAFIAFVWSILTRIRTPYAREIIEYSSRYAIPIHLALAQVKKESNFNSRAIGAAGEIGLMQIDDTGALENVNAKLGTHYTYKDLFNPRVNLLIGFTYLDMQRTKHGTLPRAYSAYNSGRPDSIKGMAYARDIYEISKQY